MAKMQVWADENFKGASLVLETSVENLADGGGGMNDKISSFKIENGEWVLWSDAKFSGVGLVVGPGQYPSSQKVDPRFNDVISSIQLKVQ